MVLLLPPFPWSYSDFKVNATNNKINLNGAETFRGLALAAGNSGCSCAN